VTSAAKGRARAIDGALARIDTIADRLERLVADHERLQVRLAGILEA